VALSSEDDVPEELLDELLDLFFAPAFFLPLSLSEELLPLESLFLDYARPPFLLLAPLPLLCSFLPPEPPPDFDFDLDLAAAYELPVDEELSPASFI